LERVVKGFANHRRIEMLRLLDRQPELSLEEVAERLRINMKTASEHMRRLSIGGLVAKRYEGRHVRHAVSPRGQAALEFLRGLKLGGS
jgi:DNA-binding transcriptional ArsR family regulator